MTDDEQRIPYRKDGKHWEQVHREYVRRMFGAALTDARGLLSDLTMLQTATEQSDALAPLVATTERTVAFLRDVEKELGLVANTEVPPMPTWAQRYIHRLPRTSMRRRFMP